MIEKYKLGEDLRILGEIADIDDTEPASPEEMRGVFLNLKDDGLTEYQKYVNNWNSAPIKTYERPLISNFTDPIYDDARTHEVVDSKEI